MKVRFLRSIGRRDTLPRSENNPKSRQLPPPPGGRLYQENETADLDEDSAQAYVMAGLAEVVGGESRRRPEPPAAAESKKTGAA